MPPRAKRASAARIGYALNAFKIPSRESNMNRYINLFCNLDQISMRSEKAHGVTHYVFPCSIEILNEVPLLFL